MIGFRMFESHVRVSPTPNRKPGGNHMYNASISRQNQNNGVRDYQLSEEVRRQHALTSNTAQRLSVLAMRSWEKALTGVIALPTAFALSAAATVMYATSILEQGFEIFETSLGEIGRQVSNELNNDSREGRSGSQSELDKS